MYFCNVETFENEEGKSNEPVVLPKPVLIQDKKNWVRKSLISLGIYALFFFLIFNQDLTIIAAVLTVLLIHEFGHFFAMKAFNYNNVKLFVLPLFGAYVSGKKSLISQKQMTIIILAGPIPGIIIGFSLLMCNIYYPHDKLEMLGHIFLFLNLFNLLPFIPLDGGRLFETLFLGYNYTLRLVFTIISIIALVFIALSYKSFILIIIPVSMVFDLIMEAKNQKIREYLKQENINYIIDYEDLPHKDYWTIRDCILLSFSKRYGGIQAGVHNYSMIEGGLMQHVISILKTPFTKDINVFGKILLVIIYLVFLIGLPTFYAIVKYKV